MVQKLGRRASDKEIDRIKDAYLESLQRISEDRKEDSDLKVLSSFVNKPLMAVQYPDDFEDAMYLLLGDDELGDLLENIKLKDQKRRKVVMLEGTFNRIILSLTPDNIKKVCIDSSEYMDFYYQEVIKGLKIYTYWVPNCTIKLIEKKNFSKFKKYVKQLHI